MLKRIICDNIQCYNLYHVRVLTIIKRVAKRIFRRGSYVLDIIKYTLANRVLT